MNKKGADLPGLMVWAVIYAVLFAIAFFYGVSFLKVSKADFNTNEIEDSIIATRVINCFSNNKYFDETKLKNVDLVNCFNGDKYFLKIKLNKKDGEDKVVENSFMPPNYRSIKRYVVLENGNAILEIRYVKNLRRYENVA